MEAEQQLAEALEAVKAAHFDAATGACDFAALVVSREHGRLAACLARRRAAGTADEGITGARGCAVTAPSR